MAFSDAQKNQIVTFLGYPARVVGTRYTSYYPIYAQIDLIGADPVMQAPVEAILTELVAVDAVVAAQGASSTVYGALKKVDEVEFYSPKDSYVSPGDYVMAIRRGRMLVRRLAQRMGGEHLILSDYFGTGSGGANRNEMALG